MNSFKKILLIVVLLLSLMMTACSEREDKQESSSAIIDGSKIKIGMCFDSFVIERWTKDRDIFMSVAKELGAEVNFQSANGILEEQIRQIDYFIDKNVDVIVIICIESEGLRDVVARAKSAGIKVIAYDRLITDADVDLYITFDNSKVGELMGESLVSNGIKDKKILMLGGSPTDNNVSLVETAFENVMTKNNNEIIDRSHADGWKAELAADYILEHPEIVEEADAIMCGNDNIATAVVAELSKMRLAGEKPVTGQDADLEACQRIVEGTQLMTVYKPVNKLAQKAAECAVALAEGKSLDEFEISSMENGQYNISYLGLEPICVTKENIDDVIINSGFHLKEDVYLNVPK